MFQKNLQFYRFHLFRWMIAAIFRIAFARWMPIVICIIIRAGISNRYYFIFWRENKKTRKWKKPIFGMPNREISDPQKEMGDIYWLSWSWPRCSHPNSTCPTNYLDVLRAVHRLHGNIARWALHPFLRCDAFHFCKKKGGKKSFVSSCWFACHFWNIDFQQHSTHRYNCDKFWILMWTSSRIVSKPMLFNSSEISS